SHFVSRLPSKNPYFPLLPVPLVSVRNSDPGDRLSFPPDPMLPVSKKPMAVPGQNPVQNFPLFLPLAFLHGQVTALPQALGNPETILLLALLLSQILPTGCSRPPSYSLRQTPILS